MAFVWVDVRQQLIEQAVSKSACYWLRRSGGSCVINPVACPAKLIARMTAGTALRKKTVVALARQLAVDLWRRLTGRTSLAELGLLNY